MCILKGKRGSCAPSTTPQKQIQQMLALSLYSFQHLFLFMTFWSLFWVTENPPQIWRNQWNSKRIHKCLSKLMGKKPIKIAGVFFVLFNNIVFMTNHYKFILKIEGNALLQTRTMVPSRKQGRLQENCCFLVWNMSWVKSREEERFWCWAGKTKLIIAFKKLGLMFI